MNGFVVNPTNSQNVITFIYDTSLSNVPQSQVKAAKAKSKMSKTGALTKE
jgi:hypothetical protein